MAIGGANLFVDTNVLVYASVPTAPFHQKARDTLQTVEQMGMQLWISRQVLREFLAVLTRPQTFTQPVPVASLITQVRVFEGRFRIAEDNSGVTQRLLTLVEQLAIGGRQVHDANIVVTMQTYGITQLLTHNVADFNRFAHIISLLPITISNP